MGPWDPPYTDTKITELLTDIWEKFKTLYKNPKITIDYSHGAASHFEQSFCERKVWGRDAPYYLQILMALSCTRDRYITICQLQTTHSRNTKKWKWFWFYFDGDADRFGMVTLDGTVVTWDIILAIIARELLTDGTAERLWSKTIFQEVFCGKIVSDTVKKWWWFELWPA